MRQSGMGIANCIAESNLLEMDLLRRSIFLGVHL